jgi:hypothetical protein
MSHLSLLSLFEKSLSLYQSRLMIFSRKKYSNIEQVIVIQLSSNFQSSYHCILLSLSLSINQEILTLFLLTADLVESRSHLAKSSSHLVESSLRLAECSSHETEI